MPATSVQGKKGEEIASSFLTSQGYKIIAKNFRTRFGEIDLVAVKEETLVFVEVKTRASSRFGLPEEAMTAYKIRRIVKAGEYFKLKNPRTPDLLRIDLVAINLSPIGRVEEIKLIENVSA